jgi:hypothetical protein
MALGTSLLLVTQDHTMMSLVVMDVQPASTWTIQPGIQRAPMALRMISLKVAIAAMLASTRMNQAKHLVKIAQKERIVTLVPQLVITPRS